MDFNLSAPIQSAHAKARRPAPCFQLNHAAPASAWASCSAPPRSPAAPTSALRRARATRAIASPGDLFVALAGANCDGHDFARQAIARGAAAVLAERPLPLRRRAAPASCPITSRAYGQLCQALAGNPSQRLKVIGVTGTNGKTTTTQPDCQHSVGGRLPHRHCSARWAISMSSTSAPATLTTPTAPELAHLAGADGSQRLLACRDGSFQPRLGTVACRGRRVRRRPA